MFKRRTLFVLGAGASAEVNMPVGAQLAKIIRDKCDIRFEHGHRPQGQGDFSIYQEFFRVYQKEITKYQDAAWLIRDGIQFSNSIDDFLDLHRSDQFVNLFGKALIIRSILEAERKSILYIDRGNGDTTIKLDDKLEATWYIKFIQLLARGVALDDVTDLFNQVAFIDFNYDRCLEHFLLHAVHRLYGLSLDQARQICGKLRIIHPYGYVGDTLTAGNREVPFGGQARNHLALASGIKTYTEQIRDTAELSAIREEIARAQNIVFLGFAYHDQNLQMLLPSEPPQVSPVIFGTAYEMSEPDTSVVIKQLHSMFMKHPDRLRDPRTINIGAADLTSAGLFSRFAKSLPSDMT